MGRRYVNGFIPSVCALLATASVATTGCSTIAPNNAPVRNKQLVRRMNTEVWNNGNLDAIEQFYTPDFVLHFLTDGSDEKGISSLREHVRAHREAFPDWSEVIEHIVAEGDMVVIHFVSSGTNRGQWLGNPPTGRRVQLNEMSIFRIEDGRIAEQWLLPDIFSMQQQLAGTGGG